MPAVFMSYPLFEIGKNYDALDFTGLPNIVRSYIKEGHKSVSRSSSEVLKIYLVSFGVGACLYLLTEGFDIIG